LVKTTRPERCTAKKTLVPIQTESSIRSGTSKGLAGEVCRDPHCGHGLIPLREFRAKRSEDWSSSFSAKLGKLAAKLYRQRYAADAVSVKLRVGNPVHLFPCGIIEQAYLQLRSQGFPTIRPFGRAAAARFRRQWIKDGGHQFADPERRLSEIMSALKPRE